MIAKNAFWPLSSGPGEESIAPAERAQEDRRPADLERLVGQADEVALDAERLDPGVLRAAEVEQVVRLGMLGGDGVEHAADERARRRRDAGSPGHQAGHRSRASRTISARTARVLALRLGQDPLRGQRLGAHRVAHLRREELRAEPALAVARRQDDVAQMGLEGGQGRAAGRRGGGQARQDGGDAPDPSAAAASAGDERVVDELLDPRQLAERRLGLEPSDRASGMADEASRAPRRAPPADASSRPAVDASRSASGANSRAFRVNSPSPTR